MFIIALESCRYSFTGASIPSHLKTISIPIFKDKSGSGEPDIGIKITNQLIQKFINDNSLQVTDKLNSDCILEGTITSITETPAVFSGDEKITAQRITINVHVVYKDLIRRETIFERNFSNYTDYKLDSSNIINARKTAIEETIDKITEDILLGVVSNW
ncbi:MAG: LPS assembly lipoprotein LptE [Melioribacter sp.]|nr:LPS assembly lipoprotein LptE [Melioribacter sp.]